MQNLTLEQLPIVVQSLRNEISELRRVILQKNEVQESNDLLSVKQAASYLFLSVPTIYLKVSKKEIPFMKKGKRLYFSKQELDKYLKEGSSSKNLDCSDLLTHKKRKSHE